MLEQLYAGFLLLLLCTLHVCSEHREDYIVTVSQGQLRGKAATTFNGFNYFSFQGIPYAKPPVGSLRFKAPQSADPWEGVRDALEQGSVCPQGGNPDNEDCLFVNVYTPQLPPSDYLRPVLVWIHGGGFMYGSGNIEQQGPDYLLQEDIIIVTLNYRLGALGFLSLPGTEISSNNGLKDQTLALRWIQQNIEQFGGDPQKITIWGESAGAASVHYQMLSPLAEGLYQQVISESGSALGPWSLYSPGSGRDAAFKLGQALGVTTNETTVLIEALKNASTQEILDSANSIGIMFTVDIEYEVAPGDEAFLPEDPLELILAGKYYDVPLLIGTVASEGFISASMVNQNPENAEYLDTHFETLLPWNIKGNATEIAAEVKKFYFGDKKLSQETLLQFINMETDFGFQYPTDHQIKLQVSLSTIPIYYYRFTFNGELGWDRRSSGDVIPGVPHAEELGYIFYTSYNDPHFDAERPEMKTLTRTVKMWTNFVKFGNPTPEEDILLQNVTWKPFTQADHYFLDIGNDLTLHKDVLQARMDFMEDIYSGASYKL